ncbi:hypothetical protein PFTANZ_06322, partial [Plasmodium falciparum Tanzania (2000708)]
MCDRNLEEIYPEKIATAHNLLVDVLLAAKHEGKSLVDNYEEYKKEHNNFDLNLCTELARSFADIGDIIRGKDLFLGHKQRKKHLEKRLEQMFKNIKGNNNSTLKGLSIEQVREYWWALNRDQVWKAITCDAGVKDTYSKSPEHGTTGVSHGQCGHEDQDVQTYLDYVPQYLRWFQEWSEDFCRIRYDKLKKVKEACRGDKNEKYCSRNGLDCTRTIRRNKIFHYVPECNKCLFTCNNYIDWIDKQKKEFEKQKKKYNGEILAYTTPGSELPNGVKNMYYKDFYTEFKRTYENIHEFLNLLNKETKCINIEKTDEESKIDFNDSEKTFSASKYCKPCPECGVKKENGEFKVRGPKEKECQVTNDNNTLIGTLTNINVLSSGDKREDIYKKLKNFCDKLDISQLTEKWKCYHLNNGKNKCLIKNNVQNDKGYDELMDYYNFFHFWVSHMLKDSIEWRKELNKCIKTANKPTCMKWCINPCECFKRWIGKKEKEWREIKHHYEKQDGLPYGGHYAILEGVLVEQFFNDITEAYDDPNETERIKKMLEKQNNQETDDTRKRKTIIDFLLDHEKDDANKCLKTHTGDKQCINEFHDDEEDEEPPTPDIENPCAEPNGSNTKHRAIAHNVAYHIQKDAHAEASKRSLSLLKADALEGKYLGSGQERKLKNICSITEDHSNCTKKLHEPCDGKDSKSDMFDITKGWKNGTFVNETHTHTYMPPRRQHFCTSNLEYLQTKESPLNGSDYKLVNNSFLGDVLLSANKQVEWIKKKYKDQPHLKDNETMCRAVKYSFADLGDIIKGTDLWDENEGEKRTQNTLKEIFDNIYNKNSDIQKIYNNIDDEKHLHLREDWWEANRKDVWRAMQCGNDNPCSGESDHTPLDDYIPQRLRWMTEWAEWYCKVQKEAYKTLERECKDCKEMGGQCKNGEDMCKKCTEACTEYNRKIEQWKKQWEQISGKYQILYLHAQTDARNVGRSVSTGYEKDQHFLKFFKEIRKENYGKKTYETAEGYVHQEATMNCDTQTQFCKKKHGVTQPTGTQEDDDYTFRENPKDHDGKCSCDKPQEKKFEVCNLVKDHFTQKENVKTGEINGCNRKNSTNKWDCSQGSMNSENNGACMPPRRQSLCISNLRFSGETQDENKLREAFIKCAAKEIHFAWDRYKNHNSGADEKLKRGEIPEEFKRQMYYTFGDYRDFLFGTDISKNNGNIREVNQNINNLFKDKKGQENVQDNSERVSWWGKHGPDIWEAMLCGLTYDLTENEKKKIREKSEYQYSDDIEKFAKKPQFLRWFTEWGEHFCREHKTQLESLKKKCPEDTCTNGDERKKQECTAACEDYKKWLKDWKENYKTQSEKYFNDKAGGKFQSTSANAEVNSSTNAYEYLNKVLQKICTDDYCKCMDAESNETSKKQQSESPGNCDSHDSHMPASLDDTPSEYKDRCDCKSEKMEKPDPSLNCIDKSAFELYAKAQNDLNGMKDKLRGKNTKDIYEEKTNDTNGDNVICKIKENGSTQNNECNDSGNPFDDIDKWECTNPRNKVTNEDICIPPRRKYMCTKPLQNLETKTCTSLNELLNVVLRTAAYEGKHIKDSWDRTQNRKKRNQICDAMKYSFADLADIVRGTDKYKNTNGNSSGSNSSKIEENLKTIFSNIQKTDENFQKKYTNLESFRSAWWDANREYVWKAMTCSAPEDATLFKKLENSEISNLVLSQHKCGYENDPPVDDYIPQPFRWMKEWSEHFCRVHKKHLDDLQKECGECNKNNSPCWKDRKGKSCRKCQEKCKAYNEMIEKWKAQWNDQQKNYNQLYFSRKNGNKNGENHTAFIEKMKKECKNDHISADKFIEKASNCTNITFNEQKHDKSGQSSSTSSPYAFELPPKGYNVICGTTYRKSCLKLKRSNYGDTCPNKINLCGSNAVWKKLPHYNIYVPPRTQQLCLEPLKTLISTTNKTTRVTEYDFSKTLQICAYNQAKSLHNYYSKDGKDFVFSVDTSEATEDEIKKQILESMKRSFADYGNLIKGRTQFEYNGIKKRLQDYVKTKLKYNGSDGKTTDDLWNKHKSDIWHAMICAYNDSNQDKPLDEEDVMCKLPDNDTEDEFLRWFTEWGEDFCARKKKEIQIVNDACKFNNCEDANNESIRSCQKSCLKYKTWVQQKKIEYKNQTLKYNNYYKYSNQGKESHIFLKDICKGKCACIEGNVNNDSIHNIFEEYPENVKMKCECQPDPCSGLSVTDSGFPDASPFGGGQPRSACPTRRGNHNKCPTEELCNFYNKKTKRCHVKTYDDYYSNWDSRGILKSSSKNEGVLVPPRRRHICLRISTEHFLQLKNKPEDFERLIYSSAANEAKGLIKKYGNDNNKLLQAIKYSFADIGNVVKGDDMMQSPTSDYIGKIIGDKKGSKDKRIRWWNIHKKNVWDAMLCAYKKATSNEISDPQWCSLPKEDETPQFLR